MKALWRNEYSKAYAALAALLACFFIARFFLLVDISFPLEMEECHTGAVAGEIIDNGFRFPIEKYSPEYYENSIIVASIMSAAPVSLIGLTPFALKLVPALFASGCLVLGYMLLLQGGRSKGLLPYSLLYIFGSTNFTVQTMDCVGNHIMGLFIGMSVLYSMFRWARTGRAKHFHIAAFCAGFGMFLHLGSIMYCGLFFLSCVLFKPLRTSAFKFPKLTQKDINTAGAILALSLAPFLFILLKTDGQSVKFLLKNAGAQHGSGDISSTVKGIYHIFDFSGNAAGVVAICAICVICAFITLRSKKLRGDIFASFLIHTLLVFTIFSFLAVVIMGGGNAPRYFTYFYLPLFMLAGAVFSTLLDMLDLKNKPALLLLQAAAAIILTSALLNNKQVNLSAARASTMLGDKENAYCYWRFGRAFGNYTDKDKPRAEAAAQVKSECDKLEKKTRRLECYWGWAMSGMDKHGIGGEELSIFRADEAKIVARGAGAGWKDGHDPCFSGAAPPGYESDCFLGHLEWRILYGKLKRASIPCMGQALPFEGQIGRQMRNIHKGDMKRLLEECRARPSEICPLTVGYCGAVYGNEQYCGMAGFTNRAESRCLEIFAKLRHSIARDATIR